MCYAAIPYIIAAVSTAVSYVGQKQTAENNQHALEAQETEREAEITQQAGNADSQAAMEARQARAQATVAAGASGVNLGSGSFLASLQTTSMNQANNAGLVSENENNQTLATVAETNSNLAARASSPTALSGIANLALSEGGVYIGQHNAYEEGVNSGKGKGVIAGGTDSVGSYSNYA